MCIQALLEARAEAAAAAMEEDEDREHEQGTAMEVTKSRAKQRKKRSALLHRAAKQVSCRAPRPRRRVSPLP